MIARIVTAIRVNAELGPELRRQTTRLPTTSATIPHDTAAIAHSGRTTKEAVPEGGGGAVDAVARMLAAAPIASATARTRRRTQETRGAGLFVTFGRRPDL
jgi:hypothetical protein